MSQSPPSEPAPFSTWLLFALFSLVGCGVAIVLALATSGPLRYVILFGLALFGVFGLPYILWGWLFERIYRSQADDPSTTDGSKPN